MRGHDPADPGEHDEQRGRAMNDVDYGLVRRLQGELGRLRQEDVLRRRAAGLPALTGEDARQHGRALVQRVVGDHESALAESGAEALAWQERQGLVEALEARLFGAGSLQALLDDENVENVDINGFQHVFVEYADGTTAKVGPVVGSDEELIETIQTLAAHVGLSARAFDVANVRVNLRLPDGSRLYAVQSVTRQPVVSIRRHRHPRVTLKDLIALETLDVELAEFLAALVRARKNVILAGATSAGKTTLLRALASEIGPEERLLTVERSLELGLDEDIEHHPNAVAFEERLPNAEGAGAVRMAELVRDTLRMNPSRVIVGEVLGDEVVTMLNAMSQGNDGSLSTIHANSSADVIHKVATYAIQAPERLPWEATVRLVATALDFIVFLRRDRTEDGQRRVVESIREIAGISEDGQLQTNELWGPDHLGHLVRRHGVQVRCHDELIAAGWRPDTREPEARGWS
jgi:pilus assembly protein CpaF